MRVWPIFSGLWFAASASLGLAGSASLGVAPAQAQDLKRHALSLVGEPKFPAGFKHFSWVNPDAPKGGRVRQYVDGTFDSFNQYPIQGQSAAGVGYLYDQLFATSPDEASTEYGHLAAWVSYPADFSSATFELRPEARFHDGKPVTPEDVIFSLAAQKQASPQRAAYWKDVERAEKTGDRQVTFRFSAKNNRELPHIISQMSVLPKHWWAAKSANGEPRDIMKSSLEIPLGSGPYRIKSFEPGREIVYERVKDWWAKDLPQMKGQYNFDELQVIYFRDRIAAFESFKAGNLDYWVEVGAKAWATEFEFDAIKKGLVKKMMPDRKRGAPMQGYYMNTRKKVFQDVRVRRAFNLAFDFEWANKNLFYGLYARTNSYFENQDLASSGLPTGRELEILTEVKAGIPPEVFTEAWKNPVSATPEDARKNLSEAVKLLAAAGYTPKNGVLTNAAGEPLAIEILLDSPNWDRIVQPYRGTLEKLGVKVTIRQVDSAQYSRRKDSFDFDLIVDVIGQSESPGNEQRDYWGSAAAKTVGSRNSIGVANPAIDTLIDKVIFAKDRADLVAACRALDRVLLWNHFVVPHWFLGKDRVAMWDQYAGPANPPERGMAFFATWWWDAAAAAKLKAARGN
jgi:microcin C transport system substrate-binding protein